MFLFVCFILEALSILINGVLCVVLPIVFYAFKNKPIIRFLSAFCVLFAIALTVLLVETFSFEAFRQFFGLIALIPIMCYNNKVGKINLKYMFYIAYPLHLLAIMIIKLI